MSTANTTKKRAQLMLNDMPGWTDREVISLWRLLTLELITRNGLQPAELDDLVHEVIPTWPVYCAEDVDAPSGEARTLTPVGYAYALCTGRFDKGYKPSGERERRILASVEPR